MNARITIFERKNTFYPIRYQSALISKSCNSQCLIIFSDSGWDLQPDQKLLYMLNTFTELVAGPFSATTCSYLSGVRARY